MTIKAIICDIISFLCILGIIYVFAGALYVFEPDFNNLMEVR